MRKSKGRFIGISTETSLGYNVNREAEEPCPAKGAAGGTQSGIGTGGERVWGPGLCGGPVSALDEVIKFVESGKMLREAPTGLTGQ